MKKEKILIVEDELDLLDLIAFNLTREGYETACALDGVEALEKAESWIPDLIVLDLMLPKLDGWEICRLLRASKNDVPIIMLTAKCMPEDREKGLETGADDYLTKPFSVKELGIRIRKLLENSRRKDIGEMFVHEVSNKAAIIGAYSELLMKKDRDLSPEDRERYLRNIKNGAAYTSELIEDIGSLFDVEAGDFSLETAPCDVGVVLKTIVESFESAASCKEITLSLKADPALPKVEANFTALKQVFANIVGNAIKYGRHRGAVEVCAKTGGNTALVTVKDDGAGIPESDLPSVFNKGFRAGNVGEVNGSGLGLYITRKLLSKMGGRISVRSKIGEGCVFTVILRP